MGAEIRAQSARKAAQEAARATDRAAEAWSLRMEGHGGPAQCDRVASAEPGLD
jgi:hypothetical protein